MQHRIRLEGERMVCALGSLHSGRARSLVVVEGPVIDLLEIVSAESAPTAISADSRAVQHGSA